MIPLAIPNLNGNEKEYLNRCIDTTFISSVGEFVIRIEEMTAQKCNSTFGIATSSGTTGLHLALIGSGVQPGNIVIIPSFTFIATANAVAHCGAIPWLMDVCTQSWTMDADKLEVEIKKNTIWSDGVLFHRNSGRKIAAIMPVYTLGNIPDMDKIGDLAKKYSIPLIADAAAAIGAELAERKIGELSDLSVLSFNGNKTITAGGGGMILGNDKVLMKKLKHLSTTARVTTEYDHDMVGYNYRMTNIQAAVACAQMERMEELVKQKRKIRAYYKEQLGDIDTIELFPDQINGKGACWFSGIVLKNGGIQKVRDICDQMKKREIEVRSFWKPIHMQKPYKDVLKAETLEISEQLWDRIITLPCSTNITEEELKCVSDNVKELVTKL